MDELDNAVLVTVIHYVPKKEDTKLVVVSLSDVNLFWIKTLLQVDIESKNDDCFEQLCDKWQMYILCGL